MNDAQYALWEIKQHGYSDGEIAYHAGVSRQALIDVRKGRSSGKKIIGKLWRLKSQVSDTEAEDIPPSTAIRSTASKQREMLPAPPETQQGAIFVQPIHIAYAGIVIFILLLILVFALHTSHHHKQTVNSQQSTITPLSQEM